MRIEVAGIPAPQGSKRHVGGGRMVEVSRAVGPWREAVRAETQRACVEAAHNGGWHMMTGAVIVQVVFRLPRPKSAAASAVRPVKRPDLDKLTRAVLDGLTDGGAFADDSQVVILSASKIFATPIRQPGCTIVVQEAGT